MGGGVEQMNYTLLELLDKPCVKAFALMLLVSMFWLSLAIFHDSACLFVAPWVVIVAADLAFPHYFDLLQDRRERL